MLNDLHDHTQKVHFSYGDAYNSWTNGDLFDGGLINFGLWYDSKTGKGTYDRTISSQWLYDAVVDKLNITEFDTVVELGSGQGAGAIRTLALYNMQTFVAIDVTEEQVCKTQIKATEYVQKLNVVKIKNLDRHMKLCTERDKLMYDISFYNKLVKEKEQEKYNITKQIEQVNYVLGTKFLGMLYVLEPTDAGIMESQYLECKLTVGSYGAFCDVKSLDILDNINDKIKELYNKRTKLNHTVLNLDSKIKQHKSDTEAISNKIAMLTNNLKVLHQDACETTLDENYADKIYSVEMAQHIHDFNKFAREIARVLKPSGKLVFCSHHATNASAAQELLEQNMLDSIDILTPIDKVNDAFQAQGLSVNLMSIGKNVFDPLMNWTEHNLDGNGIFSKLHDAYHGGLLDYYLVEVYGSVASRNEASKFE